MEHFDAVVFDMDGLLLDSERIAFIAFNEALTSIGLKDEKELFLKTVGTNASSCKRILREGLSGKADPDHFGKVWFERYLKKTNIEPIPLKDGVIELILHLKNIGMPAAVATSTETNFAIKKLENSGIIEFFNLVIGGDKVQYSKPNPEIYLKAIKELSSVPVKTLGLEDSENGVRSAVSAGLTVVQIPDMVPPNKSFRELGHIVLDSLVDVIDYEFIERF